MTASLDRLRLLRVSGLLALLALAELVLLRTGTRTLIHIPGLGRFETPIRILAEVGRAAFYLAVVSLMVTLTVLGYQGVRDRIPRQVVGGIGAIGFLVVAGAGRLGVVSATVVAWFSLVIVVVVTVAIWRGARTIPIGLFALAWVAASWSALGQGTGGGLTGRQIDGLVVAAEMLLILAAVTAPLLLKAPPRRPAIVAGLVVAVAGAGAFASSSSTLSILVLWNLGVPGWLPGVAYAIALGCLAATLWSAVVSDQRLSAIGLVLLAAGGLGTISTYQTGLVVTAILLLGHEAANLNQGRAGNVPYIRTSDPLAPPSQAPEADKALTTVR